MMKKVIPIVSVILVTGIWVGTITYGAKNEEGAVKPEAKNHPQWFFQKMDANHDGKISMEEWHQGWKNLFNLVDTNKDGFWEHEEAKAFAEKIRGEGSLAEKFARMDKNRDGKVTRDEWVGPPEVFQKLDRNDDGAITKDELPSPEKGDIQARLQKMDANGDKKISKEEWQGPPQLFTRIDTNQDGFLTLEELQEFHKKTRGVERGGGADQDVFANFDQIDKNKDGKVSPEELDAWVHQLFLKLDRNGDGVLDPSDRPAPGQGKPHLPGPRAGKHRQK